jgi:hypothetical protein
MAAYEQTAGSGFAQAAGTGEITKLASKFFNAIKARSGARLVVDGLSVMTDLSASDKAKDAFNAAANAFSNMNYKPGQTIREILSFEYSFTRSVDRDNQPSGPPRGGQITVTVKSSNTGNCELHRWMSLGKSYSGKIEIFIPGTTKKMKDIIFKDGFCIGYTEKWDESSATHTEKITIACRVIEHGGAKLTNEWRAWYDPNKKPDHEIAKADGAGVTGGAGGTGVTGG